MPKLEIITIAGRPGSGKSTTSKALAQALHYGHFSSGDLFRDIVRSRGIELLQANLIASQIAEIDYAVDERLREIGTTETRKVIDSRMAWHWIPNSFKVYLDLDLLTAAERIIASTDPTRLENEHIPANPEEYAVSLEKRLGGEAEKYMRLYAANPYDTSNYDLVVDTKAHTIEQCVELIIREYTEWLRASAA